MVAGAEPQHAAEHLAAAGAGDKVYAVAGRNADGATRSVESFIIGSDQWNDEGVLHDARSGIGAGTTSSGRACTGGERCPAGSTRFRRSSATTANDGDALPI